MPFRPAFDLARGFGSLASLHLTHRLTGWVIAGAASLAI